jgi:ATP-binding cassette subfamily B (MDR/TAP) protein 1
MAGSQLVHRIRLKAFACLLRQETAYFDRPENSSSAISVRLSSDAAAIEQMVGTRLGAICEVVALALVALICGLFFSWQLTMIVLVSILIITCFAYVNIYLTMRVREKSSLILERANMVRLNSNPDYFIFRETNSLCIAS